MPVLTDPHVDLLTEATAANNAPTAATDGVELPFRTDIATLFLWSTAGSGTMTVTCKLWGYNAYAAKWFPLGTHATAASKGLINEANAIAETGTDAIAHAESVVGLLNVQRVYLEITTIGGTSTAISACLDCNRAAAETH